MRGDSRQHPAGAHDLKGERSLPATTLWAILPSSRAQIASATATSVDALTVRRFPRSILSRSSHLFPLLA